MSGVSAIRIVQVGVQSGTTDTPGSFKYLDAQGELNVSAVQTKLPQTLNADDGEITGSALGPKTGGFNLKLLLRGKGSGAGNGVAADCGESADLLTAMCGAVSTGTGHTSDDNDPNPNTTTTLYMASTSGLSVGSIIMVQNGTLYEARPISAVVADTSITVPIAFTAAPAASAVVYASQTFYSNASDADHSHLYFKVEGDSWRRDFLGCAVKGTLELPIGGQAALGFDVMANDWDDVAEANPTYSASSALAGIPVIGCPFYLGGTKTELIEASVDFGYEPVARVASEGANGANGYLYKYTGLKFSGKIYHTDATLNSFQSTTKQQLFLQIGDVYSSGSIANCAALFVPELDVTKADIVSFNGVDAIDFSGVAVRPASTYSSSFYFSVFGSAT